MQTGVVGTAPGHRGLAGWLQGRGQGHVKLLLAEAGSGGGLAGLSARTTRGPSGGWGFLARWRVGPPNEPRGAAEWSRKASPAPGWGVTGSHFCHMPHGSARFLPSEGTRPLPPRPRVGLTSREEQAVRGRVGDTPSPHGPLSQPGQHAGVFPIHTVAQATTSALSSRWPATQVRPWWGALGHLGDLGSPCGKPPGPQGPWTSWQEQWPLGRRDGQATRPPCPIASSPKGL